MFENAPLWTLLLVSTAAVLLASSLLAAGWNVFLEAQTRRRSRGAQVLNALMSATQCLEFQRVLEEAARVLGGRLALDGILVYWPEVRNEVGAYTLVCPRDQETRDGAPQRIRGVEDEELYRSVLNGEGVGLVFGSPEDPILRAVAAESGRLSALLVSIPQSHKTGSSTLSRGGTSSSEGCSTPGLLIGFARRPRRFTPDEQDVFEAGTRHLGTALDNARFHQSIRDYSAQLEKTRVQLEQAIRAKRELDETIAHDFRSPLAVVKGYVDLLLAKHFGPLDDDVIGSLEIILTNVENVIRLSTDLGALHRIDQQEMDLKLCRLKELVRTAAQSFRISAEQEGVSIREEYPGGELPPVLVDRHRIGQVLNNLLGNALKYSPAGRTILVKVERRPRSLLVSVSDQGPGIPANALKKIWMSGYQIPGMERRGGQGLGLAIVKRLVEAHGGRVFVTSILKKGSQFGFELPAVNRGVE